VSYCHRTIPCSKRCFSCSQ